MKLSIKEILDKIEELGDYEISNFISSLDLTHEQIEFLSEHEDVEVRREVTANPRLTSGKLVIKLTSNVDYFVNKYAFIKLRNLNTLSSDDLEDAYDLIKESKYIGRENFEETFDYIAEKFPELKKLAKMFKEIIIKGKKDLSF